MTPIRPDRWSYFPPVQIFGRNIVPLFQTSAGPAVPLDEVARAISVPVPHVLKLISRQRGLIELHVAGNPDPLPADRSLRSCRDSLCLGMDGIALIILGADPGLVTDAVSRQRLLLAKKWLLLQLGNRLKTPGRKNQPRWDSGLNRKQVRELKKLFDGLSPPTTADA
jgi:hypothetical protein